MTERGHGRPDQPKFQGRNQRKEQGGDLKKEATNTSFSPVEPKTRGVVFDCLVPKIIPSPEAIWRMFADSPNTQEVQEMRQQAEQEWLDNLKTMDRTELKQELTWAKAHLEPRRHILLVEYVQKVEWQLEVIQKELRGRK